MTLTDVQPYGDVLSVLGALTLFLSWLATNTFGQKLAAAKSAYETASDKRRLYEELGDIQRSIDNVSTQVVHANNDLIGLAHSSSRGADERLHLEYLALRLQCQALMLNSLQIDRGYEFCQRVLDQHRSDTRATGAKRNLLKTHADIGELLKQKEALFARVQDNLARYRSNGGVPLPDIANEDRKLHQAYRGLLEPFGALLGAAVEASNANERELGDTYRIAKQRSEFVRKAAFYLYIVGTIAVLGGTVLAKFVPSVKPTLASTTIATKQISPL